MHYALIKNGLVENVIVASPEFVATIQGYERIEALDTPEATKVAGPGWIYNVETREFTSPTEPDITPTRRLSRLAFINRFTDEEFIGILDAAKMSTSVEMWVKKLDAVTPEPDGTSVDLDDPRTIAGVNALELAGLIGEGRAAQVLA